MSRTASRDDVICDAETDKALHIEDANGTSPWDMWVPKSVIDDDSEVWRKGQRGRLVVAAWWGLKNDLFED